MHASTVCCARETSACTVSACGGTEISAHAHTLCTAHSKGMHTCTALARSERASLVVHNWAVYAMHFSMCNIHAATLNIFMRARRARIPDSDINKTVMCTIHASWTYILLNVCAEIVLKCCTYSVSQLRTCNVLSVSDMWAQMSARLFPCTFL